jgi:Uma2 family endonuclease
LRYDLKIKLPYFAAAGITEVWIQDLNADVLHIFREPKGKAYATSIQLKKGESISLLASPDIRFSMEDLLGSSV